MKELPAKTYEFKDVEERLYRKWMEDGCFTPTIDPEKEPFVIVIPPPNITGQLHMGHALDNIPQDIMIRTKRMQGVPTLWVPGTDHASIATEVKIIEQMAQEGLTKQDIGREGFLERAWNWKEQYGGRIVTQLKKMGCSCDWTRERFTMDEGCSRAVREVFVQLYNKGLIYRGNRIINWCPNCRTALSDTEVEYEDQKSSLWHIRYSTPDGKDSIVVATTRPETMLGDTAVAVNPEDERYAHLIGKTVVLPLMNREIPVVADEYVEKEFGTGAVKITPAHDPNDFEVGQRHELETICVMDDTGIINENGGVYCGLERFEARKKIVEDLQALGALVKIEAYDHNVGACYRCGTTVEPMISEQWFVSMKPLAKPAIEAVREGRIKFVPDRFNKIYFNWMENVRDWCISRQLWWGHSIPAWYCRDCGEVIVATEDPTVCPKCGSAHLDQDEDVLDTWFSSGLWPFSTLGWPDQTEDLKYFYPTSTLVTGYEIIFFWVARMIVFGLEIMGEVPFKTVMIHGIVRDEQGRKMSKSLGNGIDPLVVIDEYGTDALRFSLIQNNSIENDSRFYMSRVEAARNFANKIWNAARFVLMNVGEYQPKGIDPAALGCEDKWILTKLGDTAEKVTAAIERMELGLAAQMVYDFLWSDYCDWYIEMCKPRLNSETDKSSTLEVLLYVLDQTLRLLHPFMPFITEEIFQSLPNTEGSIMLAAWPEKREELCFCEQAAQTQDLMELVRAVRNVRRECNVPTGRRAPLYVLPAENREASFRENHVWFERLSYASELNYLADAAQAPSGAATAAGPNGTAYIPLGDLIDLDKERARLDKEADKLKKEIARSEGKLNNAGFVDKAPQAVVEQERQTLAHNKEMLERVQALRKTLGE
ncbi:MAG: valine--tRNA ligase [Clostridia bacterium]|nr:valine--tRNA ligase [Clostridia bacterium]